MTELCFYIPEPLGEVLKNVRKLKLYQLANIRALPMTSVSLKNGETSANQNISRCYVIN